MVGQILSRLPANSTIPWQRVVNSRNEISFPNPGEAYQRQRHLLENEGVVFNGLRIAGHCRWQL